MSGDVYKLWPARAAFVDPKTGCLTSEAVKAVGRIATLFGGENNTLPVSFTYVPATGTGNGIVYLNDAGELTSTGAAADGQFLIGDSGNSPVLGSLAGTAGKITVVNGAGTITVTIDASYAGQSSITTLGTIAAGIWNATTIAAIYGGTGQSVYAVGDILYAASTSTLGKLTLGAPNRVLGVNATGTGPEYKALNGTANQVTVTHGVGSVTFSLPQNIDTGATPDFVGLIGTVTNDNAAAGVIGEYIEASLAIGSPTSLVTNTSKTVTSISLTAGDWDVSGWVGYVFDPTTSSTAVVGSVSLVNNTNGTDASLNAYPPLTGNAQQISTPTTRVSISATTTVYLVAYCTFTVSTAGAYGKIRARRVR